MTLPIISPSETQAINDSDKLRVAIAQIAPVWLDRTATLAKVHTAASQAAEAGANLVVFGEALVPGYPFWVERTDGARFNHPTQKALFSRYLDQGVVIERGDLNPLCDLAKEHNMAMYLGVMEAAPDRGGHSLYCALVYIDPHGKIGSVHRKLCPTYEERLVWSPGDGHGLRVHALGPFIVGGLNCYENWMPLPRASLYAQGENLHVGVWPGGLHNTQDNPVFVAREARSYVIAASGLMHTDHIPTDMIARDDICANGAGFMANGGSALVGPDGECLIAPVTDQEALLLADIDQARVREERQNFDPSGHYSRPDVTQLSVNRTRQSVVKFDDETPC